MFRFSIRELMLVTLVVALAFGWGLDHHRMSVTVANAKVWRTCAGALEHVLVDLGWMVQWEDTETVQVRRKDGNLTCYRVATDHYEPSPELATLLSP